MGSDTKSRVFGMAKNPFVIFSRNHVIQPSWATYMVVYLHHWWIATAQGQQPRLATAPRIAPWIPSRLCGISLLPCTWVVMPCQVNSSVLSTSGCRTSLAGAEGGGGRGRGPGAAGHPVVNLDEASGSDFQAAGS